MCFAQNVWHCKDWRVRLPTRLCLSPLISSSSHLVDSARDGRVEITHSTICHARPLAPAILFLYLRLSQDDCSAVVDSASELSSVRCSYEGSNPSSTGDGAQHYWPTFIQRVTRRQIYWKWLLCISLRSPQLERWLGHSNLLAKDKSWQWCC